MILNTLCKLSQVYPQIKSNYNLQQSTASTSGLPAASASTTNNLIIKTLNVVVNNNNHNNNNVVNNAAVASLAAAAAAHSYHSNRNRRTSQENQNFGPSSNFGPSLNATAANFGHNIPEREPPAPMTQLRSNINPGSGRYPHGYRQNGQQGAYTQRDRVFPKF